MSIKVEQVSMQTHALISTAIQVSYDNNADNYKNGVST